MCLTIDASMQGVHCLKCGTLKFSMLAPKMLLSTGLRRPRAGYAVKGIHLVSMVHALGILAAEK
jgi:hypothetical protein